MMRVRPISIRIQLIVLALLVAVAVAALFLPFARVQVEDGFAQFEAKYVAQERERLERVLRDRAGRLGQTAIDYSHWDDTVEYVAGERPQWLTENLTADVFANFGVAAIVVADRNLDVIAARAPEGEVPGAQAESLVRGAGLCEAAMRDRAFQYRFAWLDGAPQIVACAPIMPVEPDQAAVVGAMAWAMQVDESVVAEVRSLTRFPFQLHAEEEQIADRYDSAGIVTRLPLRNSDGTVGLMATLELPRPLGMQRDVVIRTMLLLLLSAVAVSSILMLVFLEYFVSRRIRRASQWVRSMRREEADGTRVSPPPEDPGFAELRVLTQNFAETHRKVRQLNHLYLLRSSISGLIVRAKDRERLFRGVCRILVETGHFAKAWIGLLDPDRPPVRILAWAGAEDDYFEDLQNRFAANVGNPGGMLARALASGRVIVSNDIAADPTLLEQKKLLDSGSRAIAILPLLVESRVVGVISIHAVVPGFFDDEETALLSGLASDVAFALDNLQKTDRLRHLANHDALTGLPNRDHFVELVSSQGGEPAGDGGACVVVLDLVRFRRINETLGRRAGDELLCEVGARLRGLGVPIARAGADVFALWFAGTRSVGELVREFEHVTNHCFGRAFLLAGEDVRMGCRFGAAVAPGDGNDAETLLRNAESALRKARGSAVSFVFFAEGMNTTAAEALAKESKLRRAIERGEFVLHYQPKFRFSDRRICGAEALIRWQDPDRGLVPPAQFIPVLEETGLISAVGRWALRQALDDAARWRTLTAAPVPVAVNVSAQQLNQPNFVQFVAELVGGQRGVGLELEITESTVMDDVDRKIEMLSELRALGVGIAIDDFGTGYSSLGYLSRLPVTTLKIDRSFVGGLMEPQGFGLVTGILAIARPLGLTVVAEGVETEEQAHVLGLLRCDEAQGYYFGRPVPFDAFAAMLVRPAP